MKTRGFEIVSTYADKDIALPQRATHHAAGYDFEAAEEVVIPSIWKAGLMNGIQALTAKDVQKQSNRHWFRLESNHIWEKKSIYN